MSDVTEAVKRAAEAIGPVVGLGKRVSLEAATAGLSAGLVIEEMARVIDPSTVEPMRSKLMDTWRQHGLDADLYMADAEARATERATALRAALLGRS